MNSSAEVLAAPEVETVTETKLSPVIGGGLDIELNLEKLGEKLGEFKAYDSQLPVAEIAGTRIVKCLYQKNAKTGEKARTNSFVRIPTAHITEEVIAERIAELTPYILTFLQEQENDSIRSDHKAGACSVYVEYLSLDKIVEKLESKEEGARLNKDKIEAWFEENLAGLLIEQFAVKMGVDINEPSIEEIEKLEMILEAYKKKFASLASGKTFIKEDDCVAMVGVITACGAEKSLLGSRFIARLEKMSSKEDDLLLSL